MGAEQFTQSLTVIHSQLKDKMDLKTSDRHGEFSVRSEVKQDLPKIEGFTPEKIGCFWYLVKYEKVLGVKTEHTIPTYLLKNENMLNNNY